MRRHAPRSMVVVIATLVIALVALSTSPVGAAFTPSKKAIKKIAKRIAKKQAAKQAQTYINELVPGMAASSINQLVPGMAAAAAAAKASRVGYGVDLDTKTTMDPAEWLLLAEAEITAPSPGFLILQGSTYSVSSQIEQDILACGLAFETHFIESSLRLFMMDAATPQGADTNGDVQEDIFANLWNTCETHAVIPVNTGSHTVTLIGASLLAPEHFEESVVSAQWVPFDGTGQPPSSFGIVAPDRGGAERPSASLKEIAEQHGFEVPDSF